MLMQSSFCSSIETAPFKESEYENSIVYDWLSHTETCQMFHKLPEHSQGSSLDYAPITDEVGFGHSFEVNDKRICSEQSTTNKSPIDASISLVYSRRKSRGKSTVAKETKMDQGALSIVNSGSASVAEIDQDSLKQSEPEIKILEDPITVTSSKFISYSPAAQACVSDGKLQNCVHKTRAKDRINGGCSLFRSNFELRLAPTKTGAYEDNELSSSGLLRDDISAKDFCISILRNSGLLEGGWPTRTSSSVEEEIVIDNSSTCSRLCKVCGLSAAATKMLICDKCDEAFHMYCCNIPKKNLPEDGEWFCPSCLKRKQKILEDTATRKQVKITSTGKCKSSLSKSEANPILKMLRDSEPYTTGVRIGKNFQAEVPDWSGSTISYGGPNGEPEEIDPLEGMHELSAKKPCKLSSIGNWLQCRAECVDGTVCGKWRRAPLSEVQTDDWECYCCICWDPSHADCAVPQELETDEIMKQLKYIEMLRPRLDAKRRKVEGARGCPSQHSPEEKTNTG